MCLSCCFKNYKGSRNYVLKQMWECISSSELNERHLQVEQFHKTFSLGKIAISSFSENHGEETKKWPGYTCLMSSKRKNSFSISLTSTFGIKSTPHASRTHLVHLPSQAPQMRRPDLRVPTNCPEIQQVLDD